MPGLAFAHDHLPQLPASSTSTAPSPYNDQSAWAGIATLNGLPATTMPIGHDNGGLPIGIYSPLSCAKLPCWTNSSRGGTCRRTKE